MSHQQEVLAAAVCIATGSWLLWHTYEGSGRRRPFWVKILPGT